MPDIICVGLAADDTFRYSATAWRRAGLHVDVVDLAQLAFSGRVSTPLSNLRATTIELHGERYRLDEYAGAFVRLQDIASAAPSTRLSERSSAIFLALGRIFTHVDMPVVNPPLRDRSNFAKVSHAAELSTVGGFATPCSCLTNDPETARRFLASCPSGAVFKGVSSAKTWATKYEVRAYGERLDRLHAGPVLFQELIDGPDARVHVVGGEIFAEQIWSEAIDYRTVRGNRFSEVAEVPEGVRTGALAVQRWCGVPFLGIDFKIDRHTGEWFFLEANPMPGYDGYDRRAGGRISSAIANWILGRQGTPAEIDCPYPVSELSKQASRGMDQENTDGRH